MDSSTLIGQDQLLKPCGARQRGAEVVTHLVVRSQVVGVVHARKEHSMSHSMS